MPRYVLIAVFVLGALYELYGVIRHFEKKPRPMELQPAEWTWKTCCEHDIIGVWARRDGKNRWCASAYREGHDYTLCWAGGDWMRANALSWEGHPWHQDGQPKLVLQVAGTSQWELWPTFKRRW